MNTLSVCATQLSSIADRLQQTGLHNDKNIPRRPLIVKKSPWLYRAEERIEELFVVKK